MLSELLPTERVRVPLGSHSKADLQRELVRVALGDVEEAAVDRVVAAVREREDCSSTAMGAGLAVPHGRTDFVHEVRLAAGLVRGVDDYVGPDGIPVRVAFLVLTPEHAAGQHVKVLSQIARVMHDPEVRASLLAAKTSTEFLVAIRRAEAA